MNVKSATKSMDVTTLGPFLAITFGLTWGIAVLVLLFTDPIVRVFGQIGPTNPLYILAVYGPAFSAFFLIWRYYGIRGLGNYLSRLTLLRMPYTWWLFLIAGVPALFFLAAAIGGTITDSFPYQPWYSVLPTLMLMLVLGPVEEFGWRGLALPLLQRRFAPLLASVILGMVWGVWHLPAFFIGGTPHSEWVFAQFFVAAISISVIMTAMFNISRGSILIAALFHFQLNNPIWPDSQPWDMIVFSVTAIVIVLCDKDKMLGRSGVITRVLGPDK